MADTYTAKERSELMARVRGRRNETTELRLMRLMRDHHVKGWRRHLPLSGRPDFTFRGEKLVVFVDGCFWHGCPAHGRIPATNNDYWTKKILRNRTRDAKVTKRLRADGWRVLRLWEHDLNPAFSNRSIRRVKRLLAQGKNR